MKQIRILILMGFLTSFCACRKNLLDVQPVNLLSQDQIFASNSSVAAYFASLYRDMPMEDFAFVKGIFNTFPDSGNQYTANWDDEAASIQASTLNAGVYDDIYKAIRNVNSFIALIPNQPNFDAATKTAFLAEARFVRAYYYWGLVKYYGGVPLLTTVQATPVALPRNKEVEVYDQIKADLDFAAANLPADPNATLASGYSYGYGHANKWAALALEARAMLHAGTIGKYGTVQLNGVVGVDAGHTTTYLQAAFDASAAIMTGGKYSLYMKYPTDLQKNFQYLFYDTKQGDSNSEAIFCRGYDYATTQRTHSQDLQVLPDYIKSAVGGYSNALQPTLDLVEKFEKLDGTPGLIGGTGLPNVQYHFPTMGAAFADRDNRLGGTIVLNGSQFRNSPAVGITGQRGVILNNTIYASSNRNQYFNLATKSFQLSPVTPIIGSGNSDNGNNPYWLKKWTDPVTDLVLIRDYTSRTSWMDLRYGEVLLDYAEASFELGHNPSEALGAINLLRTRAGVIAYTAIDLTKIRHERFVELAYENKTYWDYIRWRTLTTDFNNRQEYSLQCYWDIDTQDYVYIKVTNGAPRNYVAKNYYFQIPAKDRASDPLLIDNPGY